MPKLAPSLLAIVLFAVVALLSASPAAAAQPCWKELVNDYWADNRVDKIYPISCYREAMEHLPSDVEQYSDAQDDLRRALLLAIRDERVTSGFDDEEEGAGGTALPPSDDDGPKGFFAEVLDRLGPQNASDIPVPLLVLALIALLLLGAAGASYGARWVQARRLHPAPTPAPPADPQP